MFFDMLFVIFLLFCFCFFVFVFILVKTRLFIHPLVSFSMYVCLANVFALLIIVILQSHRNYWQYPSSLRGLKFLRLFFSFPFDFSSFSICRLSLCCSFLSLENLWHSIQIDMYNEFDWNWAAFTNWMILMVLLMIGYNSLNRRVWW